MAEFYEVLKRAVGALPENSGDARRAVYERARKALIAQLEGFSPPLTPSEITSQRLSLEEAIRKVEGEAARAALGLGLGPPPPNPIQEAPAAPVSDAPDPAGPLSAPQVEPDVAVAASGPDPFPRPAEPADDVALTVSGPPAAPDLTVSEPHPAVAPAPNREPAPSAGPSAEADPTLRSPPPLSAGAEQSDFPQEIQQSRLPLIAGAAAAFLIVVGLSAVIYSQRDALFGEADSVAEAVVETPATSEDASPAPTQQAARPSLTESPRPEKSEDRIPGGAPVRDVTDNAVRAVQTQRVTVPPNAQTGGLGTLTGTPGTEPATPVPNPGNAAAEEEAEPETQVAATEPTAQTDGAAGEPGAVAQTAFLYEEGAPNSGSSAAVRGQVVWNKTTEDGVSAVVANVTVPEKDATITITIKPNNEDGFPASHLVEMEFSGVLATTVRNVPGLIMKTSEQEQGEALVGAAIKVTDGLFWIALSAEDRDLSRNRSLLESRGWLDIPLLYGSGKRAILTLEKGVPGDQAIEAAFGDWGRG